MGAVLLSNARRCLPVVWLLAALSIPLLLRSNQSSLAVAYTGGFAEPDCSSCHPRPANPLGGSVALSNPPYYLAGATFTIAVAIQDSLANRSVWGFQLSARFADGKQAGNFKTAAGLSVQTSRTGVQYVSHQRAVVARGNGYTFSVDWTAPPGLTGGDVIFNAAAVSSDGSGKNGARTFTAQATSYAAIPPKIGDGGMVNAASFSAANAAAPGSLISIFGTNLASNAVASTVLPMSTDLGGSRVLIGGLYAPLLFVSPWQINAQVPLSARPGQDFAVVVQVNGVLNSPAATLHVDDYAPAFFTFNGSGKGAIAALHADYRLLNAELPAKPAEYVLLYCTGLGQTLAPVLQDGQPGAGQWTAVIPTLTIGGVEATVSYSGAAPGFVGLYQINAIVPVLPAGDHEVLLSIGGRKSPAGATIRVQP